MLSRLARRRRVAGLVPILLAAGCAVIAVQLAAFGPAPSHQPRPSAAAAGFHRAANRPRVDSSTTTAPIAVAAPPTTSTTSTTAPPPAPPPPPPPTTTTTTAPPPAPASTPAAAQVSASSALPPEGRASAWGCAAAVAYLSAYAHPGFTFECPGNALGREAMTCVNDAGVCPGEQVITIADPCPAAYMNEASNSWVMMGQSTAPIDPYGAC